MGLETEVKRLKELGDKARTEKAMVEEELRA